MSELLTVSELAARLRVSPATVRRWSNLGKIPALAAGRHPYRYNLAEVERVMRERAAMRANERAADVAAVAAEVGITG